MSKKSGNPTPMTQQAAQRIQSAADRTGTNAGFKSRAMAAAAVNTPPAPASKPATVSGK